MASALLLTLPLLLAQAPAAQDTAVREPGAATTTTRPAPTPEAPELVGDPSHLGTDLATAERNAAEDAARARAAAAQQARAEREAREAEAATGGSGTAQAGEGTGGSGAASGPGGSGAAAAQTASRPGAAAGQASRPGTRATSTQTAGAQRTAAADSGTTRRAPDTEEEDETPEQRAQRLDAERHAEVLERLDAIEARAKAAEERAAALEEQLAEQREEARAAEAERAEQARRQLASLEQASGTLGTLDTALLEGERGVTAWIGQAGVALDSVARTGDPAAARALDALRAAEAAVARRDMLEARILVQRAQDEVALARERAATGPVDVSP